MKKTSQGIIYSPSDLLTFFSSPFASWMDRYYLEYPYKYKPDKLDEQAKFIISLGNKHEQETLKKLKKKFPVIEINTKNKDAACQETCLAIEKKAPVIYQAFLEDGNFAGFADFLIINSEGNYQVWDTKLAFSLNPDYVVQLCSYVDMLAKMTDMPLSKKFGLITGTQEWQDFFTEDYIYYYYQVKEDFLSLQNSFTGDVKDRPEPEKGDDYKRWKSCAESYFQETDHLAKLARISSGQIKILRKNGIHTIKELSGYEGGEISKIYKNKMEELVAQAKLQTKTKEKQKNDPHSTPEYEIITSNERGLTSLPEESHEDVFFDIEGYPLIPGGLEYLFGACYFINQKKEIKFRDFWAHNRKEEKVAFENFVDWVYEKWQRDKKMHIYHYAQYEVSAMRRLSTAHNTKQEKVDDLLRNEVFVDLYRVIKNGVRVGTKGYSIKDVELLYRPTRETEVSSGADSIVQYSRYIESSSKKEKEKLIEDIRKYNEDDCYSTYELVLWLRKMIKEHNISIKNNPSEEADSASEKEREIPEEVKHRLSVIDELSKTGDDVGQTLSELLDFHRREEKTKWWHIFDLLEATKQEMFDDLSCIANVKSVGEPTSEKRSLLQKYTFSSSQECKISSSSRAQVMFLDNIEVKFSVISFNPKEGEITLKVSEKKLNENFNGSFPQSGSLVSFEHVSAKPVQERLVKIGESYLQNEINPLALAMLTRKKIKNIKKDNEGSVAKLTRVASIMNGDCLTVQGPPGTGKTYTASHTIVNLVKLGCKIGITSNSHKAINNLLETSFRVAQHQGVFMSGAKVGGDSETSLSFIDNLSYFKNPDDININDLKDVTGGTVWLFAKPQWEEKLDFLFIDEAGQVPLANALAMSKSAKNIVLLGDQMQLKQPIQGSHPGDAGFSCLQYALKDTEKSTPDVPVFLKVVSDDVGIFLEKSWRMHPDICQFISDSIYDGKLTAHQNCQKQKIKISKKNKIVKKENGLLFVDVKHEGNTQKSIEEAEKVVEIYEDLINLPYVNFDGEENQLQIDDFLFIAPYNAQVNTLKESLPEGARVGSVDKFQGQEGKVCILSLCSSYNEYGKRGLSFILDRNRLNVAISRAQCLFVVVADGRIANSNTKNINDITLLNLFCKLKQNC